jgi:hypothetical protein
MEGNALVGEQLVKIQCAVHLRKAEISVQAILSYKWLTDKNFIVHLLVFTVCTSRMKIWRYLSRNYRRRKIDRRPPWTRWWPFFSRMYTSALFPLTYRSSIRCRMGREYSTFRTRPGQRHGQFGSWSSGSGSNADSSSNPGSGGRRPHRENEPARGEAQCPIQTPI